MAEELHSVSLFLIFTILKKGSKISTPILEILNNKYYKNIFQNQYFSQGRIKFCKKIF